MRRIGWLTPGLALAALALTAPGLARAEDAKPQAYGTGPAYEALSRLAVMHAGRVKPLDTLAREEVKQIYGRESAVKLLDDSNKVVATWGPVAAMFDWSVRPKFWDEQAIILVEYVPLKRLILAKTIEEQLLAVAGKSETPEPTRAALRLLAADPNINAGALHSFLAKATLPKDDRAAVEGVAALLSEEHKWLSPEQLEDAEITPETGRSLPFATWWREVMQKKRQADNSPTGDPKLSDVERRAYEVGTRLVHYQAIRDREVRSVEPLLILPRPHNAAYLAAVKVIIDKARKSETDMESLSILELDTLKSLDSYWHDIPGRDHIDPSTDPKADAKFSAWLRDKSVWVPLRVFLDSKPEALAQAGYPADKVQAFLTAFHGLETAERERPGAISEAEADAVVDAARALGESANDRGYPAVAAIDRETYFNETNPFFKAPVAYGFATALLAASLGFVASGRKSFLGKFGLGIYTLGLAGMAAGIGLEVFGFYLRIKISGWAPVTNMYETVIWVSLVAAVLGLAFEAIFRKTFAALAGSATALLGTVLAANVPLLDPDIKSLQPVLRSNYWLTIHVLTEVSSYGAFLLAAVLGLIATLYYLTATYRRSPSFTELALPLVPGLPLFAVGTVGLLASGGSFGPSWVTGDAVFYLSALLAGSGGMLAIGACCALVGEVCARMTFKDDDPLGDDALAGSAPAASASPALAHATATGTASASPSPSREGSTATLARPSVAEIVALSAATRPKLDARGRAMQETALKIKPLSNFIYRTMQVGVLLIAAGTILGGIWADYSWGRFWGWDPKEVWALITLLVYLIPLHGRFAGWFNTFALVVASVVCSLSVIMAWYGVNFVLGVGLHSYGFVEGGGQGVVAAVLAGVMALPIGAAWRRALGSRPAMVPAA